MFFSLTLKLAHKKQTAYQLLERKLKICRICFAGFTQALPF